MPRNVRGNAMAAECPYGDKSYPSGTYLCIDGKCKQCQDGKWVETGSQCGDQEEGAKCNPSTMSMAMISGGVAGGGKKKAAKKTAKKTAKKAAKKAGKKKAKKAAKKAGKKRSKR